MTPGERSALAAEVGLELDRLQRGLGRKPTATETRRFRKQAIVEVAARCRLPHATVLCLYEAFEPKRSRGRPNAHEKTAAAKADMLARLLFWAFRRLPAQYRPDAPLKRVRSAVDAYALAITCADRTDLRRYRNGVRSAAKPASDKTSLLLSYPLLREIVSGKHVPSERLGSSLHRSIVTSLRVRSGAFRLVRLHERLAYRRYTAERYAQANPSNFSR